MSRAVVPLAGGFEEIEAVTIVDILRRARLDVVVARVGPGACEEPLSGSRGLRLVADRRLSDLAGERFDALVLAGGMENARALREDDEVRRLIHRVHDSGGLVGAICAAPWVLEGCGLLEGRHFTCHPSVAARLEPLRPAGERVVIDGNLVTSQGPGTAMEFAFTLVERLVGPERAVDVNDGVLARRW